MDGTALAFWSLSAVSIACALGVVISRNLFHSAMWLIATLLGVGGLYLTLNADFLFAVQILIYAGAIAVVIVFGVMLTVHRGATNPENNQWPWALIIALLLAVVSVSVLSQGIFPIDTVNQTLASSVEVIAAGLFGPYVLPFELISVLLLVALIGAIVIAREDRT